MYYCTISQDNKSIKHLNILVKHGIIDENKVR